MEEIICWLFSCLSMLLSARVTEQLRLQFNLVNSRKNSNSLFLKRLESFQAYLESLTAFSIKIEMKKYLLILLKSERKK